MVLLIDLPGNLLHFRLQPSIKVQKTPRQRYVRQRGIGYQTLSKELPAPHEDETTVGEKGRSFQGSKYRVLSLIYAVSEADAVNSAPRASGLTTVVDAAWRAAAPVPGRYRRGGVGRYSPVANFAMTTNMATCIVPWIATTPTNQRIQRPILALSGFGFCSSK